MRYILALLPSAKQSAIYVQAAREAFSPFCDGYLLDQEKSHPHITVCSFHCQESLIRQLCEEVQKWGTAICSVKVLGLMLKKGKVPPHHYSVSLSIARDPLLLHLHHMTADLLKNLNISILNPIEDLYFPHLTLAGISWMPSKIISINPQIDDLIELPLDPFHLALGKGDDIGQYVETLYKF